MAEKILIVDDDQETVDFLRVLLSPGLSNHDREGWD